MTDTLDGRAIGRTLWLPPSGSITITLDVSTSDDPDISGRDVELWFQPLSLGAPDSGESLVTVTRDYTDAATGVATYTFDAGALWTAVGSSTVRGLVVPASGEPWFSLLVVLDLDGTAAQTATTLPAIVGGSLELAATLSTVAGSPGPAGADGNTVLYGSGAPDDAADGVDGDFYIDTDGPTLYGPKAAGAWPSGVSMVGPSGSGTGDMLAANNLSDVADVPTARTNLGLGTAAIADSDDFATGAEGDLAATAVQPGDLGNSAGLDVGTTAGTVAAGDDSRLSDDRDPNAHASTHQDGGADELALDASQVTTGALDAARLATGTATDTYVIASDSGTPTWTAPSGGGIWSEVSETVLGSDTASLSFTGLDSYAEVELSIIGQSDGAGGIYQILATFNSDTGANYNWARSIRFSTASAVNDGGAATSATRAGVVPGVLTNSDRWGYNVIRFRPDQATANHKVGLTAFTAPAANADYPYAGQYFMRWTDVTNAITSIQLTLEGSTNWKAGTVATLLGRT